MRKRREGSVFEQKETKGKIDTINRFRKTNKLKPLVLRKRTCLRCEKEFTTYHRLIFMCGCIERSRMK
jgi:hypothetical protein